ncbi:unnamed protein product [Larinioides sclopetarius]|uniref:Uncharacterized protein n=1 Tax=Larinioides sclopetarius TaxID=280406 RepID=A0AAV2A8M0_9ARAC
MIQRRIPHTHAYDDLPDKLQPKRILSPGFNALHLQECC